jgi:hypothetical protein
MNYQRKNKLKNNLTELEFYQYTKLKQANEMTLLSSLKQTLLPVFRTELAKGDVVVRVAVAVTVATCMGVASYKYSDNIANFCGYMKDKLGLRSPPPPPEKKDNVPITVWKSDDQE